MWIVCDSITMRTWTRLPVVEFQTFSVRLLAAVITVLSWRSHATMVTFSFVTLSSSGGGLYFLQGRERKNIFMNVKGKCAGKVRRRQCIGVDHVCTVVIVFGVKFQPLLAQIVKYHCIHKENHIYVIDFVCVLFTAPKDFCNLSGSNQEINHGFTL